MLTRACASWAPDAMGAAELRVVGLGGLPDMKPGHDIAALVLEAAERQGTPLEAGDVLIVTQKIVSKTEGRVVALAEVEPGAEARTLAEETGKDPRLAELILRESRRIVRKAGPVLITETRHGFVCANAGVDLSNVGQGLVALLPEDPDRSAEEIRSGVRGRTGCEVAVGVAGMAPFADYVGQVDPYGQELRVSILAVADELAAAAELVMGKLSGVPVALVRGYDYPKGHGTARDMIR